MKIDIEWPLPSAGWPVTEMNEYDIVVAYLSLQRYQTIDMNQKWHQRYTIK